MNGTEDLKYNADELVPVSFLTKEFILDRLRTIEQDPELKLIRFDIQPGSGAGDHYASLLFKITVSYESQGSVVTDRRFLLKTMPIEDGEKKDFLTTLSLFPKEIKMYQKILPAMEDILTGVGERAWWPRCIYTSMDPQVLIFEDLTQINYRMVYDNLNVDRMQLIIEKIAQYHALSMVLSEKDEEFATTMAYGGGFESETTKKMVLKMTRHIKYVAEAVKSWEGLEHIGKKLENFETRLVDNFLSCYSRNNNWGFNVLNHGDFCMRNMMFRTDENGEIEEVMFLDFQSPLLQSPAFDIYSMLNIIGTAEVRDRKGEVIKMYHDKLTSGLKRYGFEGKFPSLIDLHVELLYCSAIDAFETLCKLPILHLNLRGVELAEIFSAESKMSIALAQLFNEPEFAAHMKKLLYSLDNRGVFE